MKTRMHKQELLAQLEQNRDAHHGIFEEALKGYREQAVAILEEHIEAIRSGKVRRVAVHLPQPADHTKDYDRVISMVRDSQDDTIELTEADYSSYVLDDWQWKHAFLASNSRYSDTAAGLLEAEADDA